MISLECFSKRALELPRQPGHRITATSCDGIQDLISAVGSEIYRRDNHCWGPRQIDFFPPDCNSLAATCRSLADVNVWKIISRIQFHNVKGRTMGGDGMGHGPMVLKNYKIVLKF